MIKIEARGLILKLFGLKSCDTCRKALKELAAAGWSPEVIDVRADGISNADLAVILQKFGDKALNRASTTWRNLSEADKAAAPEALLSMHPTLLKRPVIEHEDTWTIGWKADAKTIWLGET